MQCAIYWGRKTNWAGELFWIEFNSSIVLLTTQRALAKQHRVIWQKGSTRLKCCWNAAFKCIICYSNWTAWIAFCVPVPITKRPHQRSPVQEELPCHLATQLAISMKNYDKNGKKKSVGKIDNLQAVVNGVREIPFKLADFFNHHKNINLTALSHCYHSQW